MLILKSCWGRRIHGQPLCCQALCAQRMCVRPRGCDLHVRSCQEGKGYKPASASSHSRVSSPALPSCGRVQSRLQQCSCRGRCQASVCLEGCCGFKLGFEGSLDTPAE